MAESLPCFESKAHFRTKPPLPSYDRPMFIFTTGNVFNTKQERRRRAVPAKTWEFFHRGSF
ncbi:hypothetical protein DXA32_06075 [Subdoligranulum sp. OF01-18]|nr:hypothetical protein DXA32_06075 [Subdoligranulum sp. OF01-18]